MLVGEYFQIDFRNLTKITALATQVIYGRNVVGIGRKVVGK